MGVYYDKILGSFIGAAAGDALGAITETYSIDKINAVYGGPVREFRKPPMDNNAQTNECGQVTDDFSIAYYLLQSIVANGEITRRAVEEALIEWYKPGVYYNKFAGATTKASIEALLGNPPKLMPGTVVVHTNRATNGASMKIFPCGLLHPGEVDRAIDDAVIACLPTHDNDIAISGAAAVAAAVSVAMTPHPTLKEVMQAGLYGAREGEKRGAEASRSIAGARVLRRMELAIELVMRAHSPEEALRELSEVLGSGLQISEAVPAAFGVLLIYGGDPMESLFGGVNIGNDTDSIATVVGAITGAWHGWEVYPEHYLPLLDKANRFDLRALARELEEVVLKNEPEKAMSGGRAPR